MTFDILQKIIEKHNIPKNVHLTSDSGWECNATEMDGIYYNQSINEIVFTQEGSEYDNPPYYESDNWKRLYGKGD